MFKSLIFSLLILLGVVFIFPLVYSDDSQVIVAGQGVVYDLPYPGILPDNPLYSIKAFRDKLQEFFTRDNLKKADLYLHLSDKRAAMAQLLSKKGKHQLAITTLSKGEKYFLKIPQLLIDSKKQGVRPSDELVLQLKQANAKHKEVVEKIMKEVPQGNTEAVAAILQYNQDIKKQLENL